MKYNIDDWIDTESYYIAGFEIIDLSVEIRENTEVPGEKGYSDPDTAFKQISTAPWVNLDVKPYYISKIVMGAHVGTHIDSPMHAKEGGATVDKIPNEFVGPIKIIEANENLTAEQMKRIPESSIVLVRGKSNYRMPENIRLEIIRSKPALVIFGDCVNVDGVEDTMRYLQNDIPMVMGANQSAIEMLDDGDIVFALPIKLVGIEAAPLRLFAMRLQLKPKTHNEETKDIFSLDDDV